MKKYSMIYVTANDTKFFKDYISLYLMRKFYPGVSPISFYCIIACIKKNSGFQRWMLHRMMRMVQGSKVIQPVVLLIRNNVGRDFGSVYAGLELLKATAQPEDFILIRNRSSWGPLTPGWYKRYLDQFTLNDQIALVGSTIGFKDHPRRSKKTDIAHVQTYIYLSQWKFLSALMPDFPGRYATNHLEAVIDGEIELSQQLIKRGWGISSLQHPGLILDANNQNNIPEDQKPSDELVKELPVRRDNQTRNTAYYLKILLILTTILWYVLPGKKAYKTILSPPQV
jgi:hypothetical protein